MYHRGFVKLYGTILTSTVWVCESKETKLVWITLLLIADANGWVDASVPGIAKEAGVTVAECEAALARLQEPDQYSQDQEHGGRRIEKLDRGYRVLNFKKWREMRSEKQVRDAERQAAHRSRDMSQPERDRRDMSQPVTPVTPSRRQRQRQRQKKNEPEGSSSTALVRSTTPEGRSSVPVLDRHDENSAVKAVFDYWRERTNHPGAQWSDQRRRVLLTRLREEPGTLAQKVAGLNLAVDGALLDPLFNGAEKGRTYLEFENIFVHQGRNRIEKLQNVARGADAPVAGARAHGLEDENARQIKHAIAAHRAKGALPEGKP